MYDDEEKALIAKFQAEKGPLKKRLSMKTLILSKVETMINKDESAKKVFDSSVKF